MLRDKGRGILFWRSVQVTYNQPLQTSDEDDECEVSDDDSPVYFHSEKLQITNRDHLAAKMAEARQIILEPKRDSIPGNSNLLIDSIGKVCFKLVNNPNHVK